MSKVFENIDIEKIEQLADLVNDKNLSEVTIECDGSTLTIKGKKCPPPPPPMQGVPQPPPAPGIPPTVNYAGTAPVDPVTETEQTEEVIGTPVKAPIVGTYYSKPRPNAEPFVTVGSTVKKGDVLYILETMKVMNEITAEQDGIVSKILVMDGDTLEYGQTVMILS